MNSTVRNVLVAGLGAAAGLAIALPLLPAEATTTTTQLTAELSGANEVPPASPTGVGEAFVFARDSSPDTLCYVVFAARMGTPTMAHIHRGAEGVVGDIVVPFKTPGDGDSAGCTQVRSGLRDRILANPQNFYVNVHNKNFPGGAIRGQLN
jgi:CHRD domain